MVVVEFFGGATRQLLAFEGRSVETCTFFKSAKLLWRAIKQTAVLAISNGLVVNRKKLMKNKKCPVTGGGARPFEFHQRLQQFTDMNQPILFPCWVERFIDSHLQFFAVTLSRQYP